MQRARLRCEPLSDPESLDKVAAQVVRAWEDKGGRAGRKPRQ